MNHLAQRHLQEARPQRVERVDVAGAQESVAALAGLRVEQLTRRERALDTAGDAHAGGHERHAAAEHALEDRRAKWIVRRAEDHGVDLGIAERDTVPAYGLDHLLVEREAALDDRREIRTGDALQVNVRVGRLNCPLVGAAGDRGRRRQQPDPAGVAGDHRQLRRGRSTPITSASRLRERRCCSTASNAAALAELHAITSSLAPAASRCSAISIENASSSRWVRSPYGNRAVSPR